MKAIYSERLLWPTKLASLELLGTDVDVHNAQLQALVIDNADTDPNPDIEARVHDLHLIEDASVAWLVENIANACQQYIGATYGMQIALRGVAIKQGQCINSHTESHESDLMVTYWPGGDRAKCGESINQNSARDIAPTFLAEDPSRRLTDLRLPFESRHSFHIAPRPGLMLVGPAHLPHNLWPYLGTVPFIHIVAQVRVAWPPQYDRRF